MNARIDGCPCERNTHSEPVHRGRNGNCNARVADDGLPFQCVGAWARDKHNYLRRYLDATRGARARYIPPHGTGGAAFIDLFAGPGFACDQTSSKLIEGSPLIALNHTGAPFTSVILCELESDNINALEKRTIGHEPRVHIVAGDCNAQILRVLFLIPDHGLNIALVDPFRPSDLVWETLRNLGTVNRMDLIIHFPTMAIKRNFAKAGFYDIIDRAIGTSSWRSQVQTANDVPKLIDFLKQSLAGVGYTGNKVRSLAIKNTVQGVLYHMVFAAKHPLGDRIWQSIARTTPAGERELDLF